MTDNFGYDDQPPPPKVRPSLPPDPGPPHFDDLRRIVVMASPPNRRTGLIPEAYFMPHEGRYLAGAFRIPGGRRVAVAVDPMLDPGTYLIEDALTGEVVKRGTMGGGAPRLPQRS